MSWQRRQESLTGMFSQRSSTNLITATTTTLTLIYHQAVHNLRQKHRNALIGLLMTMLQSVMMVGGFLLLFLVMGNRQSPIRGDYPLFMMSGVLIFMAFGQALGGVAGAGASTSAMMKHGPMNTAIAMSGAALAGLYTSVLSALVLTLGYHVALKPVEIENWRGALAMIIFGWGWGCALGLVFLSIRAWFPIPGRIITNVFQRINMIASGKMFAGNMMPSAVLAMFDWNPLFHIIDQARGFVFINYTPHNSSLAYPLYVTLAVLMIGLMAEFVTRNAASLSWTQGR